MLLQYTFTGKEHDIVPTVHGNAKTKKAFTRTKPSVRRKFQDNLARYHVSEAVAKTRRELEGPFPVSVRTLKCPVGGLRHMTCSGRLWGRLVQNADLEKQMR